MPLNNLEEDRREFVLYHCQVEWFYLYGYCFDYVVNVVVELFLWYNKLYMA